MATTMTVGQAAEATGLTRKAVRMYESRGLLPPTTRTAAGYRLYDQDHIDTLTFIRRARALDLSLDDIREILALRQSGIRPCSVVRDMLDARLAEIDRAITELAALRATLATARAATAPSDAASDEPYCPIIER
ncbi:MerR family DNA-binding protein [Streptomyces sp. WAC07094]|uniref:MerR family transcriptional regulator n=1 Tax=Streptomyces sp. WAC07094 TaxID=3072183 RepID=UPI002EA74215|nr:MerR family DNA-binding protein [Streptomyces sp. WAC07094]